MTHLLTDSEMRDRYNRNEDPFDLTIEKWVRIRNFLTSATTVDDFQNLFQATNIAVPFCFKYQITGCKGCPLEKICGQGSGQKLLRVMRLTQMHILAILAGNQLPKQPLLSQVDNLVEELKDARVKSGKAGH